LGGTKGFFGTLWNGTKTVGEYLANGTKDGVNAAGSLIGTDGEWDLDAGFLPGTDGEWDLDVEDVDILPDGEAWELNDDVEIINPLGEVEFKNPLE